MAFVSPRLNSLRVIFDAFSQMRNFSAFRQLRGGPMAASNSRSRGGSNYTRRGRRIQRPQIPWKGAERSLATAC